MQGEFSGHSALRYSRYVGSVGTQLWCPSWYIHTYSGHSALPSGMYKVGTQFYIVAGTYARNWIKSYCSDGELLLRITLACMYTEIENASFKKNDTYAFT